MNQLYGKESFPLIIIHGGASPIDPKGEALTEALKSIESMASICMTNLLNGMSTVKVVAKCLELLENDEK